MRARVNKKKNVYFASNELWKVIRRQQWNESIFYKWQKSKKFFLWPPSSKKRMPKDRYPPNDKLNETGERKWWKNRSCAPSRNIKRCLFCVCRRRIMFSHTISWWIEIKRWKSLRFCIDDLLIFDLTFGHKSGVISEIHNIGLRSIRYGI